MPFLTTSETRDYLQKNNIELQDQNLREFVGDKTIKGHKKYRNYLYDQESVESFVVKNPSIGAETTESTHAKSSRMNRAADEIRYLLDPQERSGLVLSFLLITLSIVLIVATIEYPEYRILKFFAYIIFASAIVILLKNVLVGVEDTEITSKYVSLKGSGAFFVAICLITAASEFTQYYFVTDSKAMKIANARYNELSQEYLAYKTFSENLTHLVSDEKLTLPSELTLSIACFEEDVGPKKFSYTALTQKFGDEYKKDRGSTNLSSIANINFEKREGDFLIYKLNSSEEDGLIAAVSFDGRNYLNTKIMVSLSGKSLCSEVEYSEISANELNSSVVELSQSTDKYVQFSQNLFRVIGQVKSTVAKGNSDSVKAIGNKLIELAKSDSSTTSEIAFEIMASVDGWDTTAAKQSRNYLLAAEAEESNKVDDETHLLKLIRRAKNNLNSAALCRRGNTLGKEDWQEILDCLEEVDNGGNILDMQMQEAKLKILLSKRTEPNPVDLISIAEELAVVAETMKKDEGEVEPGSIAHSSYISDTQALQLFALAYAGELLRARELVYKFKQNIDPDADIKFLHTFIGNIGRNVLPIEIFTRAFEKVLETNDDLIQLSFDQRVDRIEEKLSEQITVELKSYGIFIEGGQWSEADTVKIVDAMLHIFRKSEHDVFKENPVLLKEGTIKQALAPGMGAALYVIRIKPIFQADGFVKLKACEIAGSLTNVIKDAIRSDTGTLGLLKDTFKIRLSDNENCQVL